MVGGGGGGGDGDGDGELDGTYFVFCILYATDGETHRPAEGVHLVSDGLPLGAGFLLSCWRPIFGARVSLFFFLHEKEGTCSTTACPSFSRALPCLLANGCSNMAVGMRVAAVVS